MLTGVDIHRLSIGIKCPRCLVDAGMTCTGKKAGKAHLPRYIKWLQWLVMRLACPTCYAYAGDKCVVRGTFLPLGELHVARRNQAVTHFRHLAGPR